MAKTLREHAAEALAAIRRLWSDGKYNAACAGISALGDDARAAVRLLQGALSEPGAARQAAAAYALWRITGDAPPTVAALVRAASDVDGREAGYSLLMEMGRDAETAVPFLRTRLHGPDGTQALDVLRAIGDRAADAVPSVLELVDAWTPGAGAGEDAPDVVVDRAMYASDTLPWLGASGVRASIGMLLGADEVKRSGAFSALLEASVPCSALLDELEKWDGGGDGSTCMQLVVRLDPTPSEVERLTQLCDRDVTLRRALLEALADMPTVPPSWRRAVADFAERSLRIESLRLDAATVLAEVDPGGGALSSLLTSATSGASGDRVESLERLAKAVALHSTDVETALDTACADPDEQMRIVAVSSLASIRTPSARSLDLVSEGLKSSSKPLRLASLRTLESWGSRARYLKGEATEIRDSDSPLTILQVARTAMAVGASPPEIRQLVLEAWSRAVHAKASLSWEREVVAFLEDAVHEEDLRASLCSAILGETAVDSKMRPRLVALLESTRRAEKATGD